MVEEVVNHIKKDFKNLTVEIIVSSAPVAPLANTKLILRDLLSNIDRVKCADLVIIPGLVRGSARIIEEEIGVKTFKGTVYVGDLLEMIELIMKEGMEFSPDEPADRLMSLRVADRLSRINDVINKNNPLFICKNIKFVKNPPPMNLFYEVCKLSTKYCPSPRASSFEILVKSLKDMGYSGVILGYEFGEHPGDEALRLLNLISGHDLLAGIDTYDLTKVSKDVLLNCDIILNVSRTALERISDSIRSDSVLVLIPEVNGRTSAVKESLRLSVNLAYELGFKRLVIDPVLKPPLLGLGRSLQLISELREEFNEPLMTGLCNVYELMDADTPGVIALLSSILFELGVSNLLITESSRKSCGAAEEAVLARSMIYEAYARKSPPKDTMSNLLILKDKKAIIQGELTQCEGEVLKGKVVRVESYVPPKLESTYLIISPLWREQKIKVIAKNSKGDIIKVFIGSDPLSLGRIIVKELKLSNEHSLYLGFELSKAYISLKLLKNFIQDEDVFKDIYISGFKRNNECITK